MSKKREKLGSLTTNARGFPWLAFKDSYGTECHLSCSSAIGDAPGALEFPGTSYVWLGLDDAKPRVMARDAAACGMKTDQTTGWVDYPIPAQVFIGTSMHLNREQVRGLIARMQEWLDNGCWDKHEAS